MKKCIVLLAVFAAIAIGGMVRADCGAGDPAFVAGDKRDRAGLAEARRQAQQEGRAAQRSVGAPARPDRSEQ
jgi:hypothetical protein